MLVIEGNTYRMYGVDVVPYIELTTSDEAGRDYRLYMLRRNDKLQLSPTIFFSLDGDVKRLCDSDDFTLDALVASVTSSLEAQGLPPLDAGKCRQLRTLQTELLASGTIVRNPDRSFRVVISTGDRE